MNFAHWFGATPEEVMANAAVIQAVAAVILGILTIGYVTLTYRISRSAKDQVEASWQQVQQALALAKEDQHSAAKALLEEVKRLHRELFDKAIGEVEGYIEDSTEDIRRAAVHWEHAPFGVPVIHPWLHSVIPSIAQSDAGIVGLFLTLEGQLNDVGESIERLREGMRELQAAEEQVHLTEAAQAGVEISLPAALTVIGIDHGTAIQRRRVAEFNVRQVKDVTELLLRCCLRTLIDLEQRLVIVIHT